MLVLEWFFSVFLLYVHMFGLLVYKVIIFRTFFSEKIR